MNKKVRLSLGSVVAAAAMGAAILLPATGASATEGFACPENTDTIQVPYAFADDGTPELAGTVCVVKDTTVFDSMDVTDGWSAELKSGGSKNGTDVRFFNSTTRDKVELRYEPGRTELKF